VDDVCVIQMVTRWGVGIWMSKGVDMDVLVMDVEGTDGRERGENQASISFILHMYHLYLCM
jgi:hypothetical protein